MSITVATDPDTSLGKWVVVLATEHVCCPDCGGTGRRTFALVSNLGVITGTQTVTKSCATCHRTGSVSGTLREFVGRVVYRCVEETDDAVEVIRFGKPDGWGQVRVVGPGLEASVPLSNVVRAATPEEIREAMSQMAGEMR